MFITSKIIYLELQKTACTHIGALLKDYADGKKQGKHNWLKEYDTKKMIVGSIRNPWDWYVSLWAFGCGKKGGLYNRLTKRNYRVIAKNLLNFNIKLAWNELSKPTRKWKKYYETSDNPVLFRNWMKLVYKKNRKCDLGEEYAENAISKFAGFMTYRYCKLHTKNFYKNEVSSTIKNFEQLTEFEKKNYLLDEVIYQENVEEDFIRIVEKAGHKLDKKSKEEIFEMAEKKKNISKHRDASFYYDEDTKNLVYQQEKLIIEKFGYKFPEF